MQARTTVWKPSRRQVTESTACICKTSFIATAGRWYLYCSEEELSLERLRGVFRHLKCIRLKDGCKEQIPRDLTHSQLLFAESWGIAKISNGDFPVLLMYVSVADSASTVRKDLLLISCTSAVLSDAASLWLQIRIRLPLSVLGSWGQTAASCSCPSSDSREKHPLLLSFGFHRFWPRIWYKMISPMTLFSSVIDLERYSWLLLLIALSYVLLHMHCLLQWIYCHHGSVDGSGKRDKIPHYSLKPIESNTCYLGCKGHLFFL